MTSDLRTLIGKLEDSSRQALEAGSGLCLGRGHRAVELEHWLHAMLQEPDRPLLVFCGHFGLDRDRWLKELELFLNALPDDSQGRPGFSAALVQTLERAWLQASLQGQPRIQSPHLLTALLDDSNLRRMMHDSCATLFDAVTADQARQWTARTPWQETDAGDATPGDAPEPLARELDRFTEDLTAKAREGKMDPVVGRDNEIRQIIDILIRRRQNNPILTGEAGVGKTAVVEGLAQRIVRGDVPEPLREASVRSLDLGLLQAGAGMRGEFEQRLKGVIADIAQQSRPVILFIDEAHTLIGAGGQEGQNDASNLLKPALARGELRTIAATTWREYKKYFETDPALTRRFQVIQVDEPDEERAVDMMRSVAEKLREHHGVTVLDEAIVAAVQLSARYISGRQLPDKAVSLLDTACARVALSQSVTPASLEEREQRLQRLEERRQWLDRENLSSGHQEDALAELQKDYQWLAREQSALTDRWKQEQKLVNEMVQLRSRLESPEEEESRDSLREQLADLQSKLSDLQQDDPLVHPVVDRQAVAAVVARWTGIPVGQMVRDEIRTLLDLQQRLEARVIGQSQAMAPLARRIQSSRADLTEPNKPLGVFLMIGPSGTGKTETALTLAETLYGGEQNLTVINMSEFKEQHKVSMLLGSPPGYVGYGEGGVLTEAVRRKPYSVVLLDEMEKAHPGVQDVFYNILDKGTAKDGEGRDIDFRHTVIIMTSNACEELIRDQVRQDPDISVESLLERCQSGLREFFKPAFLGRTTIIPYYPLAAETLEKICEERLRRLQDRIRRRFDARLEYAPELVHRIAGRSLDQDTGARLVENLITNEIVPELARICLTAQAEQQPIQAIKVGLDEEGRVCFS